MFRRRKSDTDKTQTQARSEAQVDKEAARPRTYKPRYAGRDAMLSVAVQHRPDVVHKVRESQRKNACDEIGFSSYGGSFPMRRSGVSRHPNLDQHSSRLPNLHAPSLSRGSENTAHNGAAEPGLMMRSYTTSAIPQSSQAVAGPSTPTRLHPAARQYWHESQDVTQLPWTSDPGYFNQMPTASAQSPQSVPRRLEYFSHTSTPSLRPYTGKGKERASGHPASPLSKDRFSPGIESGIPSDGRGAASVNGSESSGTTYSETSRQTSSLSIANSAETNMTELSAKQPTERSVRSTKHDHREEEDEDKRVSEEEELATAFKHMRY